MSALHSAADLKRFHSLLQSYMDKKGLRSTDQRRLIVDLFFHANGHVSIEELLADVRVRDARIGYATVYRTLKLLAECGIAYERSFGDGVARYELADEFSHHHDHLICIECGGITEFQEPRIEQLQDEIAKRHRFDLRRHKHELYGVCAKCSKR